LAAVSKFHIDEILKHFVQSLGLPLKYSDVAYHRHGVNQGFKPRPLLWMRRERVAYLRLDGFNSSVADQFRQIHDILLARPGMSGLIIDLRSCRSFDYKNALFCLTALDSAYQGEHPAQVRLALLIGKNTLGAAEYLIWKWNNSIKPIIMGMPSAGEPFEFRSQKLSSGGYLLLPIIPPAIKDVTSFTTILPQIKIIDNRQERYSLEQSQPDTAVKYAGELLIALKILKR